MFRRKWLASVVSVVMVFAFMPISSFALDDFGVQPAENTEVSVPDAEPAADSDTEATVEDEQAAEPAPVEETTEDVSEESEQQETESAEEVKDESDDSAKMPAQEFSGTASNGIKVSVSAPEGAFPEGTEMKLKAVGHDRAVSLLEGEAEDVVDANGVDITFFKDGKEIQPQKAIKVSLSNANVEGETFNVYHVADNGAVDRVSGASSKGASFKASSFSIYVVAGSGESEQPYTVKYIFKNGDETVDTQIVKHGETLKKPEAPEKAGYKFTGWFNGEEEFTAFGESIAVTENSEVTLTAGFQEAHYVFFKHPNGGVYTTKEGVKGDKITTTDVVINIDATSSAYKWYTESACTNQVDSVTLADSNIYLYTKAETGHWITFDSNGGSFVSSQFVNASDVTVQPANPTRMGYTFNGWKLNGSSFSFGSQLDKNVTLTASWTANSNTKYTVIHWQENANDDKYSFKESETKTGTTGAETKAAAKTYNGFTAQTITQKTIAGDGSTIVNVYYKRNVYVVKFYTKTGNWRPNWTEDISKRITAKYGANIFNKWPGGAWYVEEGSSTWQARLENMPLGGASFYGHTTGYYESTANYFVENKKGDDVVLDHSDAVLGNGWLTVTSEDKYSLTGFEYQDSITINNKTYNSTEDGDFYNNAEFYYSRNSYNIVFINNGTTDKTVSKKYEASIANENYIPENPESIPDAYTFAGWYDNELCEGKAYEFDGTMPAGNITLYAKWTAPEYIAKIHVKVTDDTSEEGFKEYGISYGEKLNPDWLRIPDDIPEGATFVGWGTKSGDTLQLFDTNQQIYTDIELFPIVSDYSKTYSVIYNSNNPADADNAMNIVIDSDKYLERSYAEVKSAKALTAPNGKVFLGWNTTADGTGTMYQPGDKIRISNSNIILYAQWGDKVAAASIIYHSNYPGSTVTPTKHIQNLTNNEKTQILTFEACEACEECDFTAPAGYEFDGWATSSNGEVEYVAGTSVLVDNNLSNELYAKWKCKTFTVTWKNADGTVLEKDEHVAYGTMPSYDGETPTKAADAEYTYTFKAWTPGLSAVRGNVTYTATYSQTKNKYTVTWKNADGTVLEKDEHVPYGTMPSYDGETPTKAADAEYTYTFKAWTPEVSEVKEDAVYTATYEATAKPTTPPTPGTDPTPGDNGGNGGTTGGTPTATPAPATTAVAAAAPAPAADNTAQIEDQETPKANLDLEKDGAWALLNLLLSLLACIMSIALIITYFMKKREDEEEQNADYAASGDEEERKIKKKGLWRIISIAWAILMLIVFFLTEDMSLPMIWVDKWTILMVVMTIIQAGIMFMSRKKYEDEDEDNPQMA